MLLVAAVQLVSVRFLLAIMHQLSVSVRLSDIPMVWIYTVEFRITASDFACKNNPRNSVVVL